MFLNVDMKIFLLCAFFLGSSSYLQAANADSYLLNKELLENESSFELYEKVYSETEGDYALGAIKVKGNTFFTGKIDSVFNNGVKELGHFFINVDDDTYFELVLVIESSIRPNDAVKNWGSYYSIYVFDDFKKLTNKNSDHLIHLEKYENLFHAFGLDGSLDGLERESVIVKNNSSNKPYNTNFITEILKNYNAEPEKLLKKSYLYNYPNEKSDKYLIKGDGVTILYDEIFLNKKWYYINYRTNNKTEINMWIQADSLDIKEKSTIIVVDKESLYKLPNKKTKMYLIKGDKVTILDEKTDDSGQKWYFINYKGKKDLNMWIKSEAVELPKTEEMFNEEKTTPHTQNEVIKASVTLSNTPIPKKEKTLTPTNTKIEETMPIENPIPAQTKRDKSAGGSLPLSLLTSLLGLLAFKFS